MKKQILLAELLFGILLIVGFRNSKPKSTTVSPPIAARNTLIRSAIFCSPDWQTLNADSLGNSMIPLSGWGAYRWNIDSRADSAIFYFNQGINMYYAFHIIESLASFKKAAQFDSTNAMIYWGQALAYGPNINDVEYAMAPDAIAAAGKAVTYSEKLGQREKDMVHAMSVRYSADSSKNRQELNEAYAAAMQIVYKRHPADADISALYADSRMLQHPWQYWQHNGKAYPWTPEILSVIETALEKAPLHPGLNHYHIHMVEASPNPGRALASATRLQNMMPDVSHMVHMPSHIYIRTGNYKAGLGANDLAIRGYQKYLGMYPEVANNSPLYLIHNLHMKASCALMMDDDSASLAAARQASESFDTAFMSMPQPIGNMVQYVYATPIFSMVKFAKWRALSQLPEAPSHWVFLTALQHWARGLAFTERGNDVEAQLHLAKLQELIHHPELQVLNAPFNRPADQLKVAEKMLTGTMALKTGRKKDAIRDFEEAVVLEDNLVYSEPRDWLIPARLALASAYVNAGDAAAAARVLEEDLRINPHHYNTLTALREIYSGKKNRKTDLARVNAELAAHYSK